jgi:hypothetical protein
MPGEHRLSLRWFESTAPTRHDQIHKIFETLAAHETCRVREDAAPAF